MPSPESSFYPNLNFPFNLLPTLESIGIRDASGTAVYARPAVILKGEWDNVAAIVTNGVSVSHAGAAAAGTTNMTLGGALATGGVATFAHARNAVITVTHATAVVAMSGTITGTDRYGNVITEAWAVTATGTSKTFTGKKAFKTITQITETIAADASANTIIAGNGKVLGLPFKAIAPTIIAETEDGVAPTAGVIVPASTVSTADFFGTYTPNSALNGALDFKVWYLVEDVKIKP